MAERKTQLFFYDNNEFEFRKRELKFSCLVERDGEILKKAWKHFFGNQYYFPGYKNISADSVTLGCSRDIILDPHNRVPVGDSVSEKPNMKIKDALVKWIAKIAENQRHIYRSKRQTSTTTDRIAWALIIVLILEVIGWVIRFATGG